MTTHYLSRPSKLSKRIIQNKKIHEKDMTKHNG